MTPFRGGPAHAGATAALLTRAHRRPLNPEVFDSANRTTAWHFGLARALTQEGGSRGWDAIRHLDTAERTAPQRIHHDPIARELSQAMNGRARRKAGTEFLNSVTGCRPPWSGATRSADPTDRTSGHPRERTPSAMT